MGEPRLATGAARRQFLGVGDRQIDRRRVRQKVSHIDRETARRTKRKKERKKTCRLTNGDYERKKFMEMSEKTQISIIYSKNINL